ncbi:MAG: hypothetical protein HYY06_11400 [Deltaproteobacteria bacterium]|nr:hypothetical protein [Deltaproteobacteria bacterium]
MRTRLIVAALVALPSAARADDAPLPPSEPVAPDETRPPEVATTPPALDFRLPPSVTPIEDPRPMRFVMAGGNLVVGRRVGEDPEFVWIVLDGQLARVRKAEISSMDFRVDEPAPPASPPVALPSHHETRALPQTFEIAEPPRRRGRGLVIWGAILLGISYGLSSLAALSQESESAILLAIPIVGPALYATTDDVKDDDITLFIGLSLVQAAGALMLYFGVRRLNEEPERPRRRFMGLVPEVGPSGAGLRVVGEI